MSESINKNKKFIEAYLASSKKVKSRPSQFKDNKVPPAKGSASSDIKEIFKSTSLSDDLISKMSGSDDDKKTILSLIIENIINAKIPEYISKGKGGEREVPDGKYRSGLLYGQIWSMISLLTTLSDSFKKIFQEVEKEFKGSSVDGSFCMEDAYRESLHRYIDLKRRKGSS